MLLVVVNALIIAIGWYVIYSNAKRLATRSENRGIIDGAHSVLDELSRTSKTFWKEKITNQGDSQMRAGLVELQSLIQEFELKTNLLGKRGLEVDVAVSIKELRNSVTANAELLEVTNIDRISARLANIGNKVGDIKWNLEEAFMGTYKPSRTALQFLNDRRKKDG
ncbi:hypothetical protein J2T60_002321 [Natronospira proteinivora]|uniref:LemA family protein n=1 Tax=Natronospira proteinivora TaxID=1807133 RepID=A0ABT1GAG3_9GAMM|nr:hypothetical protein [Natronospira proteinivora]MCP1728321.1 hypothetical protein [Natronospira proteinivora]